jgi:AbrB family looped-hinge helix DNA binding protein
VDVAAKLTSKGQITVPKQVRDALGLEAGDEVVFRVHGDRAVVSKTPDFLELAGAVAVPTGKRGTPWDQVLREAYRSRARS